MSGTAAILTQALVLAVALVLQPAALPADAAPASAAQQETPQPPATIQGTVSSQGVITLPGATVRLLDAEGAAVAGTASDADGRFHLGDVAAGSYVVEAALPGFRTSARALEIKSGEVLDVKIDLELEGITDTITVARTVDPPTSITQSTGGSEKLSASALEEMPTGRDGLQAALATMAGVVQVPGGLSIRGGRPTQSSLQIGDANVVDASTGGAAFRLPPDAVQSVEILPNPYAVEFGRFSSGLTVIQTRSGGDEWRARVNNFVPSLRPKRDSLLAVTGIERFGPQFYLAGPVVKGRVFLMQSAEFAYAALDVPSRPEDEIKTSRSFNAFTRVDAHLSPSHKLTASLHILPQRQSAIDMNTFTPPGTAADARQTLRDVIVTDTAAVSEHTLLVSMFQASRTGQDIGDWTSAGMDLLPQGRQGQFFNAQNRQTNTSQWIQSVSHYATGRHGEHLVKSGIDLLHATFDGTSRSAPVSIRRLDGSLVRQLTFSGPATQHVESTDVALFVQDRWRVPGGRLLIEAGGRVDRDGLLHQTNLTWRAGGVLSIDDAGTRAIRGGVGLFYERTPSIAGAFEQFETITDTRFEGAGAPAGASALRPRRDDVLRTPHSTVWNVGYDHQMGPGRFLRIGYLARTGIDELIVQPLRTALDTVLALSSSGRSVYRELELGAGTGVGHIVDMSGSYIRSSSRGDLNSLVSFFDALRIPVIGHNELTTAAGDAPHRIVGRARIAVGARWLVNAVGEYRTGFPYSAVGEDLEFLGPRNQFRLPDTALVDLMVERRVRIFGMEPWIGVRAYNALNRFHPAEVQRNTSAPDFGGFYNSRPRQIRLQMRFQ
jgi:hypothetical protein